MSVESKLQWILEGALMASGQPLTLKRMGELFDEEERPSNDELKDALAQISFSCEGRGYQLAEVASGWRFQVREDYSDYINRLWEEKPAKYSRALLETLALIAYRQPITRGDIEEIRGVAVSSNITRTLLERNWVRIVGHRDVPGRPALYATTKSFLDYFNLSNLDQLPSLGEIRDVDELLPELDLQQPTEPAAANEERAAADTLDSEDVKSDSDDVISDSEDVIEEGEDAVQQDAQQDMIRH